MTRTTSVSVAATVLTATVWTGGVAHAHDLWIEVGCPGLDGRASVDLRVGHPARFDRSALPSHRILRFEHHDPSGQTTPLESRPASDTSGPRAWVRLASPGVHQIVLVTDHGATSYLPADRFNAHLIEEGLTPALEARREQGRNDAGGSERYGRVARAVVRVGGTSAGRPIDPGVRGLALSVTLVDVDPAGVGDGTLRVRVDRDGSPLAGATTRRRSLDASAEASSAAVTDADGLALLTGPPGRRTMFTTAWTRPLAADDAAEFETTFSSLTLSQCAAGGPGPQSSGPV